MFARSLQITIDIELGLVNGGECSYSKFDQGMRDRLKYSQNAGREAMKSAASRTKANYDIKFTAAVLNICHHVLAGK